MKQLLPKPLRNPNWAINETLPNNEVTESEDEPKSLKLFPTLFPVGQVHGTYIIAQNEDGFFMIDQHAAQERIKYEYFRDKLKEAENNERQLLLVPLRFIIH